VGPLPYSERFASLWSEATGKKVKIITRLGEYELRIVTPGFPLKGQMRVATLADLDLASQWTYEFSVEALPHEKSSVEEFKTRKRRQIEAGRVFLLEDAGQVVASVSLGGDTKNSTRIGQVYTPPRFRKMGYAGSLTAQVSQLLLDQGKQFVNLSTDLNNPTSNSLYQRIGYRYLGESAHYGFN